MKYIFILNPNAGAGEAKAKLESQLNVIKKKFDYEVYLTKGVGDATKFVKNACAKLKNETCFVACGGDGTLNEVASGLVGVDKAVLAVMSFGSGNDFIKYYQGRDFTSVEKLLEGTKDKIDILKVNDKYSINVCNFGFDSVVGSTANKIKEKGGKNPYKKGVFKAILTGRFNKIKVVVDGEEITKNKMLLCTLANGNYVGGQYKCAPKSKNNDGLIDVCLFHSMTLFKFIKLLKPYTNGEHLDMPNFSDKMVYRQAKHVDVSADKEIELCLDGEMLAGTKFGIDILPGAVNFVVPKE